MKTSLDLDRELWLKFRAACVERGIKTATMVELLMREQLAEWAAHSDRQEAHGLGGSNTAGWAKEKR